MSELASIQKLWAEHLSKPFPRSLAGEEIDNEDLVLLDSTAAGCISTFLSDLTVGSLDANRLRMLSRCAHDLLRVCPRLPEEHRAYFDALREISERVVGYCQKDSR